MMTNLLKYTLLIFLLSFAACSSEDDAVPTVPNGQPQPGDVLELTVSAADFVTDGAPDTRATDNGNETTFDDGDRVGIIILDKDDAPIYNNIPYKYKNGKWTFDSNNDEGKGECYYDSKATTYIVYYPYSRAADGVTSVDVLKTKFAPKFDQSDIKDYRASDLMVWSENTRLTSSEKELNAELTHAFASFSLSPIAKYTLEDETGTKCIPNSLKISDVSLTADNAVYVPYQEASGSLRCIVPTNITPSDIRCFYTFNGTTYGNTINIQSTTVAANTRYTSAPEIISNPYTLADAKVGDFYCKRIDNGNGYLIPSDVALTGNQKNACIGIVYCTDIDRIGNEAKNVLNNKGVATPHGLVMALTDASSNGCRWGEYKDENDNNGSAAPFQNNTSTLQKQYNNVDGYAETHWILNTYNGTTLRDTYTAFYHANRYGTTDGGTSQYAAPANTTGWFIPSMGQWWDILSYLGGIDLSTYRRTDQGDYISISGAAPTAVNNMNKYFGKISDKTKFNTGTYFWSSSESSGNYACHVKFDIDGNLYLHPRMKGDSYDKVRCVFAF